jgi:hypothetical protein
MNPTKIRAICPLAGLFITSLLLLTATQSSLAQAHRIAAFSIWKPKEGQETLFETGYKQHLQWHKRNGDKWDWYGWYVISGKNFGQFLDATFDHSWNEFDNPVNPAGDREDNSLHTDPFGDYLMAFKLSRIEEASQTDTVGLRSKFTRLIRLQVTDPAAAGILLGRLKEKYVADGVRNFQCFHVMDGGSLYQYIILIGAQHFAELEKTENIIMDLAAAERLLKTKVVTEADSELLAYRSDMSLLHPGN